jgi:hypothetical protein
VFKVRARANASCRIWASLLDNNFPECIRHSRQGSKAVTAKFLVQNCPIPCLACPIPCSSRQNSLLRCIGNFVVNRLKCRPFIQLNLADMPPKNELFPADSRKTGNFPWRRVRTGLRLQPDIFLTFRGIKSFRDGRNSPVEVVVLNCWVTDTKEASWASSTSTILAKSASERVRRSTL